jgi:hypothetical protein
MALSQQQINQLNALAGRTNLTATDRANLDYARRTYGYQLPTSSGSSTPNTPTGSVAINGAQYNTRDSQRNNFSNIYQQGNTLYGTPINNNIDSNTIQSGTQFNPSQLPSNSATQSAIDIYTQNSLQNGQQNLTTLQNQYNTLSAQQLQQTQQGIQNTQGELNTLEQQRQNDINQYRSTTDPIYQQGASEYTRMLDSLKQMDYTKLVKDRLDLTNDIVNYSNLMRQELDVEAGKPALLSVSNGRQSSIQQNYLSKIATAEAAQSAIDGNFNLAFDIMDKGATVIQNITEDRINFLNFVSGIYDDKILDRRNKLITLTADEKTQINELRTKLQKDIENIEANKKIVQNLMSDPKTAMIAHKAGLSLTDSPDVIAEKLQKYYIKNPTLISESIVNLQAKYPDAGINFWDSTDVIKSKLSKSETYKKEMSSGKFSIQFDPMTGEPMMFNSLTGELTSVASSTSNSSLLTPGADGGQCGDYTHKIADNIPAMGNTYEEKMRLANVSTKDWKVGDMLIQKTLMPYGHVSIVTAVNGNQVTVTESNWKGDEKVGTRTLTMGDKSVTGVYRGAKLKTPEKVTQTGNITPDGYDITRFTQQFYSTPRGQQALNNEQQYQTNFMTQQAVKDMLVVQNKAASVEAIINAGVGGPGDLALVFEFMKALDPNSVVRETEYEAAAKSGNIFAGAYARFNGYLKESGGILPANVKQAFLQITQQKYEIGKQSYDQIRNQFRKTAYEQGLNPEHVAPDLIVNKTSPTSIEDPALKALFDSLPKPQSSTSSKKQVKWYNPFSWF